MSDKSVFPYCDCHSVFKEPLSKLFFSEQLFWSHSQYINSYLKIILIITCEALISMTSPVFAFFLMLLLLSAFLVLAAGLTGVDFFFLGCKTKDKTSAQRHHKTSERRTSKRLKKTKESVESLESVVAAQKTGGNTGCK